MNNLQAIILGLIQGITEFLPISSSGHLVLFESILGLPSEDLLLFDVSVHMGTLLAIFLYFWKDIKELVFNWKKNRKQWITIIIASVPIVILGGLFGSEINQFFREPRKVAIMLGLTGILFWIAESLLPKIKSKKLTEMTIGDMIKVGLLQAVAMIPGVSRSGSTIAGGLMVGLKREAAARFSFLLGLVAIGGAGFLTTLKLISSSGSGLDTSIVGYGQFAIGFVVAALSGYIAIWGLMKFLKKHSLLWFTVYLLLVSTIGILMS